MNIKHPIHVTRYVSSYTVLIVVLTLATLQGADARATYNIYGQKIHDIDTTYPTIGSDYGAKAQRMQDELFQQKGYGQLNFACYNADLSVPNNLCSQQIQGSEAAHLQTRSYKP